MAAGHSDDTSASSDVRERREAKSIDFSSLTPPTGEDPVTADDSSSAVTDGSELDLTMAAGHSDDSSASPGVRDRREAKSIDFSPLTPLAGEKADHLARAQLEPS
jgi:hypothetical protein